MLSVLRNYYIHIFLILLIIILLVLTLFISTRDRNYLDDSNYPQKRSENIDAFQKSHEEFKLMVNTLPFNEELLEAMRARPDYGDYKMPDPYPNYSNMTDEEIESIFRTWTLKYWGEGFQLAHGEDIDASESINILLFSLYSLAQWGQTAYIDEEVLPAWQTAFNKGKDAIYLLADNILESDYRRNMKDFLDMLFESADHYKSIKYGEVNGSLPLIEALPTAR